MSAVTTMRDAAHRKIALSVKDNAVRAVQAYTVVRLQAYVRTQGLLCSSFGSAVQQVCAERRKNGWKFCAQTTLLSA